MEWANVIAVVTLLLGGGGLLFYQQKKAGMEIANAGALASEWEKLYREQKAEVASLRAEDAGICPYICYNLKCAQRITRNDKKNLEK